ncbi:hypothetical protein JCM30471_31160 [Desulfuromonas carbonis]
MALMCITVLAGCSGDDKTVIQNLPTATTGSLNVNVSPATATVVVTGPEAFTQTFTGNQLLTDLVPGVYTMTATATGFDGVDGSINVVAAQTSSVSLDLRKTPTTGSLNVNVTPASATVVVTGPAAFAQTFTGNQFLPSLAPGQYTATATAPGFVGANRSINVVVGDTSVISLVLSATQIISEAPQAVYRVGQDLIPLSPSDVQSGAFSFYAWVQNQTGGISTTAMEANTLATDPGAPLLIEQTDTAPSYTQNLAGAWVGFTDAEGVVRPVIGADVRWEIDQLWTGRINSIQFGTSDDNRLALGYGVFDDQADTRTNNARLMNERFPLIATQYPLFNLTGIGTPNVDGFTWVTLFSPDKLASGRLVAVATINGEEIGKQILFKNFAPQPKLQITKTVSSPIVNLVGGTATDTWTITVSNVGEGEATNIVLDDTLASGIGANYTLGAPLPAGSTQDAGLDGFTFTIPSLQGGSSATVTYTPEATVTAAGVFCNNAHIASYLNSSGETVTVDAGDLNAQACFTALESNVSIVKDFIVSATDNTSLGKSVTVAKNVPATLRVQVINNGNGAASTVNISDAFNGAAPTTGLLANYTTSGFSAGTPNVNGGFDDTIATLAAGATATYLYTVAASVDAEYCDTATINSVISGTIGVGSSSACLTVATPNLTIAKTNTPANVNPGASYISTIVVNNTGTAAATGVVVGDLLGLNSIANVRAIYVSSSLNGVAGALADNIIRSGTVEIPAGGSITFTIVSQIPPSAASGTYCNTASVTSTNAASPTPVEACVAVPAFVALQTQLIDLNDPVSVGSNVTFSSTLYVESLSNEGVKNNVLTYSFGLTSPTVLGIPGVFQVVSSQVYLDTVPVRDPVTGLVLSDASSPTAVLLTEGTDYTQTTVLGKQVITMSSNVILQPKTALYVVHGATIPTGTPTNKLYTTSYIWDSTGLISTTTYEASSSEPTTILP